MKQALIDYNKIKNELTLRHCNTRGFNKAFYNLYIDCYKTRCKAIENKEQSDDFSEYKPIYETYFYTKNSCSYCQFQEFFYSIHHRKDHKEIEKI